MNLRSELSTFLTEQLPDDWQIVGRTASLDGIRKTTLVLWATDVSPLDRPGAYSASYNLEIVTPVQDPEHVDDALDEALGDVLAAVWDNPATLLQKAERVVWADAYQAWEVTLTLGFEIEAEE